MESLKGKLKRIDGKGYKRYKEIEGIYNFGFFTLIVDHVQSDPFAPPSKLRIKISNNISKFPPSTFSSRSREVGLRDFLTRTIRNQTEIYSKRIKATGKSGIIEIVKPGQEILERNSVVLKNETIEVRFSVGLPSYGRKVAGKLAEDIFFTFIPEIVKNSLLYESIDEKKLYIHIETNEDADFLREKLSSLGLISFIADGSILPRKSGVDNRPLKEGNVVPFKSPESLKIKVNLPNRGEIEGMGIRKGITLIAGGGYHGKSTLLNAIQLGIYNHIPGDGRELVVSNTNCVKIRAEDGRRIEKVDISPFINNLPFGKETKSFSTENASGSTSQAANIIETIEAGGEVLLIDEDTSATNFMIRDHRMQELISKDKEPITPFIDKVQKLYTDYGISTVLVMGGSGDYFDVADYVICMIEYIPYDMTYKAKKISEKYKQERKDEGGKNFGKITERIPLGESLNPFRGEKIKIKTQGKKKIIFGREEIDLSCIEQIVDKSQTRAIADAIFYSKKYINGKRTLREIVEKVEKDINSKGLDIINRKINGEYAFFRKIELASAINRLRTLKMKQEK